LFLQPIAIKKATKKVVKKGQKGKVKDKEVLMVNIRSYIDHRSLIEGLQPDVGKKLVASFAVPKICAYALKRAPRS
jgi:hypothetical protein